MKTAVPHAIACMENLLIDASQVPDLQDDLPIYRHVIRELRQSQRYLLPVGGEVIRRQLVASGVIPMASFSLPKTSLTLEFQVSEAGFLTDPSRQFRQPTFIRLALVQDLRDSVLLETWRALFAPWPEQAALLLKDQILVVPLNRMQHPEASEQVWTPSWAAGLLHLDGKEGTISETVVEGGLLSKVFVTENLLYLGRLGYMTAHEIQDNPDLDVFKEAASELNLELVATIDFGIAYGTGAANIRRAEACGEKAWKAGKGPLVPARIFG